MAKSRTLFDSPPPPSPAHAAAVTCDSIEAADLVLSEIGRLDALEGKLKAECDRELNCVRAKWAAKFVIGVGGRDQQIVDRRAELQAAIQEWAEEHKAELLGDLAKKSLDLNHGAIGWRSGRDKLVPIEGGPAAGSAKLLDKISAFLREQCDRLKLFACGTLRFVRVQIAFDKIALLAAAQKDEISSKELKSAGFQIEKGEDEFFAKANAAEIESVSANVPG